MVKRLLEIEGPLSVGVKAYFKSRCANQLNALILEAISSNPEFYQGATENDYISNIVNVDIIDYSALAKKLNCTEEKAIETFDEALTGDLMSAAEIALALGMKIECTLTPIVKK